MACTIHALVCCCSYIRKVYRTVRYCRFSLADAEHLYLTPVQHSLSYLTHSRSVEQCVDFDHSTTLREETTLFGDSRLYRVTKATSHAYPPATYSLRSSRFQHVGPTVHSFKQATDSWPFLCMYGLAISTRAFTKGRIRNHIAIVTWPIMTEVRCNHS